jgi:hypothetical protein
LASLFIDNASVGDGCGHTGQITFTTARLAPRLLNGVTPADGRWVSIAEYPDLYKYYGNFFGGDSTSFRLPDIPTPPGPWRGDLYIRRGRPTAPKRVNHSRHLRTRPHRTVPHIQHREGLRARPKASS